MFYSHWNAVSIITENTIPIACVASVSVRFRSKERGTRVKLTARQMAQVLEPFLARSKPKIPFLCLSLLRNLTETLATQATIPTTQTTTFVRSLDSRIILSWFKPWFGEKWLILRSLTKQHEISQSWNYAWKCCRGLPNENNGSNRRLP